jgi:hypothetical protein
MEDAGGGWLLAARADATVASRFNLAPATPRSRDRTPTRW